MVAARGRGGGVLQGDGRLAGARRADQQRAGAAVDAAAEQRIERRHAAADRLARNGGDVLRRDEAREDVEPAALDAKSW